MYEVFVRSFQDSNGDGVGDLRGLVERLDYLNDGDPSTTTDLGVTALWLMPVAQAASYHGYDVTDYRAIETDYGTADDFRSLVAAAHARGMSVIVDLVLNHTSVDHPWFVESRTPGAGRESWYRWSDEHPGYGGPDGQRVWHADGDRFYYGLFWEGMPDLNLENPALTAELVDVARYWLTDLGVDGFRLDAIKHLIEDGEAQENTPATHAWLERFRSEVRAVKPDALLVGEVFDLTLVSASYVPEAVDLTFDFELAGKMLQGARIGEAASLATAQRETLQRYGGRHYGAFLTNHDQARVMTELNDRSAARVAASTLLTNPGVPFVYYGEELGLPGGKPDERIRTPMPWLASERGGGGFTTGSPWQPFEPGWEAIAVDRQANDPSSLLDHYRDLIAIRAKHPALRSGTVAPLQSTAATVYAFLARGESDAVAVIVNLGDEPVSDVGLTLEAGLACDLRSATVSYADGLSPDVVNPPVPAPDGSLAGWRPVHNLPPHSTLVIALEP